MSCVRLKPMAQLSGWMAKEFAFGSQKRNCARTLHYKASFLRAHRDEVVEFLRARHTVPLLPSGVRLVSWNLKPRPLPLETCACSYRSRPVRPHYRRAVEGCARTP